MTYKIYNEDEELMRIVYRKEEAVVICALRQGWTYEWLKKPKVVYEFEEALI